MLDQQEFQNKSSPTIGKPLHIVHGYANNMYIEEENPNIECFANRWGLVGTAKLGHKVTLLCGSMEKKKGKKPKEYSWNGINIIEMPTSLDITTSTRWIPKFQKKLKELNPDIIHAHHYASFIPERAVLFGKKHKIPTFLTIHSTFLEGKGIKKILGILFLTLMQPFLNKFTKIFFISNYLNNKSYFSLFLKKQNKIVAYNKLQIPPNIKNSFNVKSSKKITKNPLTLLYIGRISKEKGVDLIVKAIEKLKIRYPKIHLHILGPDNTRPAQKIKKLIIKTKTKNNITFHGKITGDKKWKFFKSCQMQIVASRDEGFGNVVIEGFFEKIPVISSTGGALKETTGGHATLFESGNYQNLIKAIESQIKEDPKITKTKIEAAYHYALTFTENKLAKKYIKEYTKNQI